MISNSPIYHGTIHTYLLFIVKDLLMKFILWGTLAALLAFNVYSEGTPEEPQAIDDEEQDDGADAPAAVPTDAQPSSSQAKNV